jgi:hypothetical protein
MTKIICRLFFGRVPPFSVSHVHRVSHVSVNRIDVSHI